jgi:hypothetical protein
MYQRNRVSVSGGRFALVEQVSFWLGCWHSFKPIKPTVGDGAYPTTTRELDAGASSSVEGTPEGCAMS